jgi:hypothetical protein
MGLWQLHPQPPASPRLLEKAHLARHVFPHAAGRLAAMLLQIQDTYIPISSIVALKKADGQYALTFWSPGENGEAFLRTVTLTGDAQYEVESWLSGQFIVKAKNVIEGKASVRKTAADGFAFDRRKGDRRKASAPPRPPART